jgi:hypothetical protein
VNGGGCRCLREYDVLATGRVYMRGIHVFVSVDPQVGMKTAYVAGRIPLRRNPGEQDHGSMLECSAKGEVYAGLHS